VEGDEMRYLLDSSVWMRSALQGHTLPAGIRKIVGNPEEILGLSIFSLWEAAKKHQKGKLLLPMDLAAWFQAAVPHRRHRARPQADVADD
jgi:PIN domain nuclease of toxin-antitoxin system